MGKTAERHTSAEFVAFLTDIQINQPRGKEIHVIADHLSAHKSHYLPNSVSVPGYAVLDAQASYNFDRFTVTLSGVNLAGRHGFDTY